MGGSLGAGAERFRGTFSTLQDAFNARRGLIVAVQQDPLALADHIANSFGDLPETHPQMFMKLAARVQAGLSYLAQNLPAGIGFMLLCGYGRHCRKDLRAAIRSAAPTVSCRRHAYRIA